MEEISRSEAGAQNLSHTADYISSVIERSKGEGRKSICFVTGVPGSGKTLAGLNIATVRMQADADEHAVFMSGNGPLVAVLREALAQDASEAAKLAGARLSMGECRRRASTFVQNIHHFRDEHLVSDAPPIEHVVVFDEAQRAWTREQTSSFMQKKHGQIGFDMSEPTFLLSVMDRHQDWCTVVCLIGGGQEINTGEAGLSEWYSALSTSFPDWDMHISDVISGSDYWGDDDGAQVITELGAQTTPSLHLAVSVRSFRAERVSEFVGAVIQGRVADAAALAEALQDYAIHITRSLPRAREWLRAQGRGTERIGLVASSNALRLKPAGIHVKAKIDPSIWFLAGKEDVRSSFALEDAATEFDIQGLELDWTGVCWDANFRRSNGAWQCFNFSGTRWQTVRDEERRRYLANAYRVLLTRARQGMVVFVPEGDAEDQTRPPAYYDETYAFLID